MSDNLHSGPATTGFEQIEAELQAALALLTDPVVPARTALPHLSEARALLLVEAGDDVAARTPIESLALDECTDDELYDAAALLLDRSRALRARRLPAFAARARMYRRLQRGALVAGALLLALILAVIWLREKAPGPWHGKYYQNAYFKGPVRARRDKDVRFNWGKGISMRSMPTDGFSIRWDTCLEVRDEITPTFQLTADDGARLYVDGNRIIDVWRTSPGDTQSGSVHLLPGSHHLRVEYYEHSRWARVALMVSLRGEKPRPVPRSMLRYAGSRYDGTNPCQSAEAVEDPIDTEPAHEVPTADEASAPPSEDAEDPGTGTLPSDDGN